MHRDPRGHGLRGDRRESGVSGQEDQEAFAGRVTFSRTPTRAIEVLRAVREAAGDPSHHREAAAGLRRHARDGGELRADLRCRRTTSGIRLGHGSLSNGRAAVRRAGPLGVPARIWWIATPTGSIFGSGDVWTVEDVFWNDRADRRERRLRSRVAASVIRGSSITRVSSWRAGHPTPPSIRRAGRRRCGTISEFASGDPR